MDRSKKPAMSIGHIHLSVVDLEKEAEFYNKVLGLDIMTRLPGAVFLSSGGYHHHIGLNDWDRPAPKRHKESGLYHFALLYPTRKALAAALKRIIDAHYPLDGAADHGVSESIYLTDPEGNGIELYCDRPRKSWPEKDGKIEMYTRPLDIDGLLAELG